MSDFTRRAGSRRAAFSATPSPVLKEQRRSATFQRVRYGLAGADEDRRFSPSCWRTWMALVHKGLDMPARAWRLSEMKAIAFAGSRTVPVLADGHRAVADSWAIVLYLEEAYPGRPPLFGAPAAIGPTQCAERLGEPGDGAWHRAADHRRHP